jgi:hypothetical protein
LDDTLASGLPPFDLVLFESSFGVPNRIPYDLWDSDIVGDALTDYGDCPARGLGGWEPIKYNPQLLEDVCFNIVDLAPRFQDLNGDGYPDLMVLELSDPEALHTGPVGDRGENPPELADNYARSRAYVQDPDATGSEDRWKPAPQFDLPNISMFPPGFPPTALTPFAHGQPFLHSLWEGAFLGCPGPVISSVPGSNWPYYEFCSPLTVTQDFGVRIVDLNRDGLSDVIWSNYGDAEIWIDGVLQVPVGEQGVLLNTGTGWCSSRADMAPHVEFQCADAAKYLPPSNFPTYNAASGLAVWRPGKAGWATGNLADLNADGWLDYIQAHPTHGQVTPGNKAWLFNPAGASGNPEDMWIRDSRYDLDIQFNLVGTFYSDMVGFAVLDINGDGAADVVGDDLEDGNNVQQPQAFISKTKHSDLLRLVRNGIGGEIAIEYDSAISQRDAPGTGVEFTAESHANEVQEDLATAGLMDVIRWTPSPVVSAIRIKAPNRESGAGSQWSPPSTYQYAHPRYCPKSRSELGFRVVQSTRPGGEVVTSKFYQTHGRAGKISSVTVTEAGAPM